MSREVMRYKLNELRMMLNDGEHGEEQGILVDIIKELDKTETQGEWIPVSERLPEESGRYLTYIVNKYDEKLQYIMTADYIARPIPTADLSPWFVDDECASDNVIAWQPLPEPYKGAKTVEPQKSKGIDLTEWTENLIHPKRTGK